LSAGSGERPDDLFWIGQDGNRVRFEACAESLPGFELALKDEGGIGEFLSCQAELGAKEDLGRPESGQSHQAQQPWRKDTGVKTHEGPKLIHE
jgi:hypothetical protein